MGASQRMLVLLLVALHLQCLYTKYYLVKTDGKAARVHRKNIRNPKHVVSSSKTGSAKSVDKKTGRVRRKRKETGRVRTRNKALSPPGKYVSINI